MSKTRVLGAALAATLIAGPAIAAQNVANTSQKGSLLVWPLITVDRATTPESTLIEISNDANGTVHVECVYVNERKGRVDFDFDLSAKQTASWDAYTLEGDQVHPPRFPANAGTPAYPGRSTKGELICFAVDAGSQFQIAWNHLTGTATVTSGAQAFKYNAWSFAARDQQGVAPDAIAVSHGTPGLLRLTGTNADGAYDACPAYNIANFMPNGAQLGGVTTVNNSLAVVSCWQDLRESYVINTTKLEFTVWNSFEHSFTGAYRCADSVTSIELAEPRVTAGSNFDYSVLRTPNARFIVRGLQASPPCPRGTRVSGLLGVLASQVRVGTAGPSALVGNTLHGAGVLPGLIRWDPAGAVGLGLSR